MKSAVYTYLLLLLGSISVSVCGVAAKTIDTKTTISNTTYSEDLKVTGTLTIEEGACVIVEGSLTIEGTVSVGNNATLIVRNANKQALYIKYSGSLDASSSNATVIITGDALVDGGKLSIGSQNSTESTLIIEGDLTIGTKNVSEGNKTKTYTGTLTTHASTVVIKKSIEGTGSISVSQTTKMAVLKTIDDGISITVATSNNGNGSGGGDASDRVYSSESFEIYYGNGNGNGNGNGKDKNTNTTTDQTSSAYIAAMDALNENKELLPIVLVSFSYEVSLNEFLWETASEYHNAYFVIPQSNRLHSR